MVDNTWHVGIIAVLRREAALFEESVVVALLHYVRTKPICVKWNQGYPKQ